MSSPRPTLDARSNPLSAMHPRRHSSTPPKESAMRSPFQRLTIGSAVALACTAWCAPALAQTSANWGYTDLGAVDGSFIGPVPFADTGYGIGQAFAQTSSSGSFSYSGSTIADVSALNGNSGGSFYVNAAGQVAGESYSSGGTTEQAFLYSGGKFSTIGSLGGDSTYVTGLNASGEVIGYGNEAGNASTHAFTYSNGKITDLKTLGGSTSSAVAINASGEVVGNSNTSGDAASHAFLYNGGGLVDLGTLGGTSSSATAINAAGMVI